VDDKALNEHLRKLNEALVAQKRGCADAIKIDRELNEEWRTAAQETADKTRAVLDAARSGDFARATHLYEMRKLDLPRALKLRSHAYESRTTVNAIKNALRETNKLIETLKRKRTNVLISPHPRFDPPNMRMATPEELREPPSIPEPPPPPPLPVLDPPLPVMATSPELAKLEYEAGLLEIENDRLTQIHDELRSWPDVLARLDERAR
jgi:hypothetical protein